MEPSLSLIPVCFGPYTGNVKEAAEALVRSGGGFQMENASELPGIFQKVPGRLICEVVRGEGLCFRGLHARDYRKDRPAGFAAWDHKHLNLIVVIARNDRQIGGRK